MTRGGMGREGCTALTYDADVGVVMYVTRTRDATVYDVRGSV